MQDSTRRQTLAQLEDTALKVFAKASGDFAADWDAAEAAGLTQATAAEEAGGIGAGFAEMRAILYAAGRHASALPVAESLLAAKLLGGEHPVGPLTLAQHCNGSIVGDRFTGTAAAAAAGGHCAHVVLPCGDWIICLATADAVALRRFNDAADRPFADLEFSSATIRARARQTLSAESLRLHLAFLRACMAGGAIDAALALSIAHVTQREQFGRKLSQFQAIQHQLAVLAEEAAAANAALMAASEAADAGNTRFPFAAAILRTSRAAGEAASIAHQVHGAIGFTREYALNHYTRMLWCWRSEVIHERALADELGRLAAKAGPEGFWPALVDDFSAAHV